MILESSHFFAEPVLLARLLRVLVLLLVAVASFTLQERGGLILIALASLYQGQKEE